MPGRSLLKILAAVATLAVLGTAAAQATVPGKNGRIVYRRYLDAGRTTGALFTVNPNGTNVRRVTSPSRHVVDQEADWSPDGKRIAFERKLPCPGSGPRNGLDGTCDRIYTMRADGKGLKTLVPCGFDAEGAFPANCVGTHTPAWSPNGRQIAFRYSLVDHDYPDSLNVNAGIWIVDADGTDGHPVTQRTPGSSWDLEPQWSPDSARLVFVRMDLKRKAEALFTAGVDGTGVTQLTSWELNASGGPDWSPDGKWILFTAHPADRSENLYKVHSDGSGLTNLTKQRPSGYHYLSSSFSPDGAMITTARTSRATPSADVVVMKANGSGARRVTKSRRWESGADWGPRR